MMTRSLCGGLVACTLVLSPLAAVVLPPGAANAQEPATLVQDIRPGSVGSRIVADSATLRGVEYFAADDGLVGNELWRSDGTAAGTSLFLDVRPGSNGSAISSFTVVDDRLFFVAGDGADGLELWRSDGTPAGTEQVADLFPGRTGSQPQDLTAVGDTLYFTANNGVTGRELWRVGSAGGPTLVKDIRFGPDASGASVVGAFPPDRLLFAADDGTLGRELWITDGSESGTTLVRDLVPGGPGSNPGNGVVFGSRIYFPATTATGVELWSTDGTTSGTQLVKDVVPGGDLNPRDLTVAGNRLYFTGTTPSTGREVFVTDGSADGTMVVSTTRGGSDSGQPTGLTASGSAVLFSADNGNNGRELWRSDGTVAGTAMIQDIFTRPGVSGPGASAPGDFLAAGTAVYFSADDGVAGRELWRYDSVTGRAELASDILAGTEGSSPSLLALIGERLLIVADQTGVGRELAMVPAERSEYIPTSVTARPPAGLSFGRGGVVSVEVASASGVPVGSVSLTEGGSVLDVATLGGGRAELRIPTGASAGAHGYEVRFSGGGDYAASSTTLGVEIAKASSEVSVSASRTKVQSGQKVNLRITLAVDGIQNPTGQLVVREGAKKRATVSVTASDAGYVEKKLKLTRRGSRTIKVDYAGNSNVAAAQTARVVIRVER